MKRAVEPAAPDGKPDLSLTVQLLDGSSVTYVLEHQLWRHLPTLRNMMEDCFMPTEPTADRPEIVNIPIPATPYFTRSNVEHFMEHLRIFEVTEFPHEDVMCTYELRLATLHQQVVDMFGRWIDHDAALREPVAPAMCLVGGLQVWNFFGNQNAMIRYEKHLTDMLLTHDFATRGAAVLEAIFGMKIELSGEALEAIRARYPQIWRPPSAYIPEVMRRSNEILAQLRGEQESCSCAAAAEHPDHDSNPKVVEVQ
jgi:hypothetical protein